MTTILFEGNNYFFGRQGNSAVTSIVLKVYVSLFLVFILTMSIDYNGVQKLTKYSILIVAYMSREHNHKHFKHVWTGS